MSTFVNFVNIVDWLICRRQCPVRRIMSTYRSDFVTDKVGIVTTGVGSGWYAGDLTPQLFMCRGYWYVYPP